MLAVALVIDLKPGERCSSILNWRHFELCPHVVDNLQDSLIAGQIRTTMLATLVIPPVMTFLLLDCGVGSPIPQGK